VKFTQPKLFPKPDSNIVQKPWFLITAAIVVFVLAVLIIYPIYAVTNSRFYQGYSYSKSNYSAWLKSTHKDVRCVDCHRKPGFINGVSFKALSVVEFYKKIFVGADKSGLLKKPSKEACQGCHERPATMLRAVSLKIPHRAHQDLGEIKNSCADCHKWLVHKEAYQEKHKKLPLSAVCLNYACHAGTEAKDSCSSCHHQAKISEVQWSTTHRDSVDKYGENGCFDYCHNVSYCQTCHTTGQKPTDGVTAGTAIQPGDLISKHTNSPDWIREHGKEALNDEAKCLNCHMTIQYCNSCHKKRPASHGKERRWIAIHKKKAKDDEKGCLVCHKKKTCDDCHELFKEKGL
jgi:hypothetical protein